MRARIPRASGESESLADHLRCHAPRYFGVSAGTPVDVRLVERNSRSVSRLYHFSVRVAGEEHAILVKRSCGGEASDPEEPQRAESRPKRSAWVAPEKRFLLEQEALSEIDRHFSSLNDPRFGTIRIFDVLPRRHAVIMERLAQPSLRRLLIRSCILSRSSAALEVAFRNAGAWLREYHGMPGGGHVMPRHTRRRDLIDFVARLTDFLGEKLDEDAFFRGILDSVACLAEDALPAEPPLGLGHGDFGPRNILVGAGRRVTVLDTLARFRTPIYEDVGYFLMNLRCGWPQVLRRGGRFPSAPLPAFERAFVEGYFREAVPVAAVRLYEVQAMLDKWASAVAAGGPDSGARVNALHAARRMMLSRLLRHEIPSGLARAGRGPGSAERSARGIREPLRASPAAGGLSKNGAKKGPASSPSARTKVKPSAGSTTRIAYIMSRFPKLTETFVLYEILTLEAAGVPVEVYPLLREHQPVSHPEAEAWVRRAHFHPFLSSTILRAHLHFIRRRPGAYFGALRDILAGTWGSANFFIGAIGIFPKVVRFAFEMEREGVTHVHAHFATHPALAGFIIRRLTGIPYSFTAHGSDLHVDRRMLDVKVAGAAFAVTVSQFNRRVMIESCGKDARKKIHVVHCGVDTKLFQPREEADRGGRDGPFRILCVASFEEVKGHRFLVEACDLLRDRGVAYRCDLVGDGPLRRNVESDIVERGLSGRVRVAGPKPRPEVARMLTAADAVVLASHPTPKGKREGIPVALMEGMACGAPVVATAISGIPELVDSGRNGFLVPSGDPGALAGALERLAREPDLRRRMGAAGREKVLRDFDLHANTLKLLELFRESLTGFAPEVPGAIPSRASSRHRSSVGRPT